jgi:hypothetical protein
MGTKKAHFKVSQMTPIVEWVNLAITLISQSDLSAKSRCRFIKDVIGKSVLEC